MKKLITPRRVLAAALLAVLFLLGCGKSSGEPVYNFCNTKGVYVGLRPIDADRNMKALVTGMIDSGMDPPCYASETSGTVFGVPVTAKNYRHASYFDTDGAVMSVLYGPEGRTLGVAFTLESDRTAAACGNLDLYGTEIDVMCPAGDPVFERTWRNTLNLTASVGTYGGRTVFFVSDIDTMRSARAWNLT